MAGPWEQYKDETEAAPWEQFADEKGEDAPAPSSMPAMGPMVAGYARQMGLAARDQIGGLAKGVTSVGTLPVDALVNAGYGGHKLLAKTGVVSEPNADFYYGKGKGYFPTTEGMSDAIDEGADAIGLPRPEAGAEGIVSGVRQGVVGALGGAGLGKVIKGGVGAFLAAEPGVQATAGGVGGGVGAAIDASPEAQDKLPAWAKVALPAAAAIGTGTGISAARAFGGHVPGFGSVRTGSTEMRDALSNTVIQGMADDPAQAARNLRARTRFEESPDFVAPGYAELSTNAAGDTGLAAARQPLGDMAGGALAERMQQNNSALTRAFRLEGADDLAGEAVQRQASDMAGRDLGRFGITGATAGANEAADITPFMAQLRREANPQTPGTSTQTRAAAREIRGELAAVGRYEPVPAPGAGMGPRNNFVADPERLQSVRNSVSESLRPAAAGTSPALPSAANARGYTGRQLATIDEILGDSVPAITGPGGRPLSYDDYLARQRGLRQEGNERSFMAGLMENLAPNTNAVTGAREFSAPKMARLGNMRQQEKSIPGAPRAMSIERLSPARQEFLDRIQNIGEVANFGNSAGTASRGASTARTATTAGQIGNTIKANAAPFEKVLDFAGRNGLTILGRIPGGGQLAAGALRGVGRLYQMGAQDGVPDAATAVRARLGRFETDRPAAIEMLTGRTVPERGLGISAARQGRREVQYGAQGFLAGQLGDRSERRRRRPYGT